VSCQSAGNCAAGGGYLGQGTSQAFVISEVNGTWGDAVQVAGITGPIGEVVSVLCPPTGSCTVGGEFYDSSSASVEAFVASQN
jgi:hypothetical protein